MKIIWAESPILAREVISRLSTGREWHAKTIRTLLARLVAKGVIGYQKQGRSYLYRPLLNEADCVRAESQSFLDRVFGGAVIPMLAHFLEDGRISDSERRELRLLLDEKE